MLTIKKTIGNVLFLFDQKFCNIYIFNNYEDELSTVFLNRRNYPNSRAKYVSMFDFPLKNIVLN